MPVPVVRVVVLVVQGMAWKMIADIFINNSSFIYWLTESICVVFDPGMWLVWWIARLTTNQEVSGSIPLQALDFFLYR